MRTFVVEWVAYESNLTKHEGIEEVMAADEIIAVMEAKRKVNIKVEADLASIDIVSIKKKGE